MQKKIALETNDPARQVVQVLFRMVIQDAPRPNDLRLLPPVLAYGRAPAAEILARAMDLRVVVPADDRLAPSEIKVKTSSDRLSLKRCDDVWQRENDGTHTHTFVFKMSWREAPPDGRFDEQITFDVQRRGTAESLVLRITGDCLAQ